MEDEREYSHNRGTELAKKLLIVDDSRVSRMIIKSKVESLQLGWDVLEAASGDEAVANAAAWAPDYVTMDVNMPGISGFDAAEQLKATLPQVRLVLLTANIQESSRERAAQLGVKFIQKPVTAQAIQQAVDHFQAAP
jgi:CheY-like chemotaxis protein